MIDYNTLLSRGFSKKEAQRTVDIMQKAEENKSLKIKFLDSFVYWALLVVAIIGNIIISILLIPFLLAFKKVPLYFTIFILAAMFGYLFDQLIRGIETIENKHQIIAWVFIPALAVIDTHYMASFANHLTKALNLPVPFHSPLIISIIYVTAFILPYIAHSITSIYKKGGQRESNLRA